VGPRELLRRGRVVPAELGRRGGSPSDPPLAWKYYKEKIMKKQKKMEED